MINFFESAFGFFKALGDTYGGCVHGRAWERRRGAVWPAEGIPEDTSGEGDAMHSSTPIHPLPVCLSAPLAHSAY